jgi:hypothetical protein
VPVEFVSSCDLRSRILLYMFCCICPPHTSSLRIVGACQVCEFVQHECPHTAIYVLLHMSSAYCYVCAAAYVLHKLLYMCCCICPPHTAIYVLLHMSSAYCYMCPHTAMHVSSGRVHVEFVGLPACRSQVLSLLALLVSKCKY